MARPTLPGDFKEFLRLLGSNGVEFDESYREREVVQIDDLAIPVISLARLRRNKKAAGRAKDLADLENLPG